MSSVNKENKRTFGATPDFERASKIMVPVRISHLAKLEEYGLYKDSIPMVVEIAMNALLIDLEERKQEVRSIIEQMDAINQEPGLKGERNTVVEISAEIIGEGWNIK